MSTPRQAYGTEEIVGKAVADRRDDVVISTKASPQLLSDGGVARRRGAAREPCEQSLRELTPSGSTSTTCTASWTDEYATCVAELVPELKRLRDEGAIRFLAISERFAADPGHVMLQRAVGDDCWDVMMVGFNLLNQSACERVFPATRDKDIAVEVMFAVRRALSRADELRRVVQELVAAGHVDARRHRPRRAARRSWCTSTGPQSVVEAAYRFVRHEPGCHVVLTGTGKHRPPRGERGLDLRAAAPERRPRAAP